MESKNIQWYEKFMNQANDRGMVIVSWAILDEELRSLLHKRLARVSGMKNIIDNMSFCRKAAWSCMVGIINNSDYENMKILNKLRNEFAHNPDKNEITNDDINRVEVLKKSDILDGGGRTKFKWFVSTHIVYLKNLKVERIVPPGKIPLSLEVFVENIKEASTKEN